MDYSAANQSLWNLIIQIGILSITVIFANILRRRVPAIRKSLMPTAVLGGFLLLAVKLLCRYVWNIELLDSFVMEALTYHCIAIGFIAMSLRIPEELEKRKGKNLVGFKSGAIIVGSYTIQGVCGLLISLLIAYTVKPDLFKACGMLLPMGYGQGPGQANNVGGTYESMGFVGGRSFGLAIAAAGYICACVVGVFYLNYLVKKGKLIRHDGENIKGSVTIDTFQNKDETPIAESIDRLSIQVSMILMVYLTTYLITWGITSGIAAISEGLAKTLNSLLWGFNFMIGSGLATLTRVLLQKLRKANVITHRYQNNYLLSRISGLAFDVMIVAGIASIEPEDLSGLWLPFLAMGIVGAVVTLWHLQYASKRVYADYYYEGLISMYGMMTGTISSGVLLLREIDQDLKTPAANNLVLGSSFAILLGAPILALVSLAPQSDLMTWITLVILVVYYAIMLAIINMKPKKQSKKD